MIGWGLLAAGTLLVWAALTGRSPTAVLQAILTGHPIPPKTPGQFVSGIQDTGSSGGSATQNITGTGGGSSAATAAVSFARAQMGDRYGWGRDGPDVWDCSGLTHAAYAAAGKTIPRTAALQAAATQRVASPAVGDLVFLGTPAYHVGIYVGNGEYINAPYQGAVVRVDRVPRSAYYGRVA